MSPRKSKTCERLLRIFFRKLRFIKLFMSLEPELQIKFLYHYSQGEENVLNGQELPLASSTTVKNLLTDILNLIDI